MLRKGNPMGNLGISRLLFKQELLVSGTIFLVRNYLMISVIPMKK